MEEFSLTRSSILKEDLYCKKCGGWVYCTEMNAKSSNEKGEEVEYIGDGCLKNDKKGEFLECPDCGSHHYLLD